MSRIAIVLAALGTCTWTPGKMEDNDSCLPGRWAEQCATTVLQKRSRHPSTCWGKVALLASWGVITLCLLWWNFCSRLEKNVLCSAGMIVIHDFHICLLMWKLRAPGFARTTCFSAKKWNHGFQREMSWCNSCLSCPEETKGFLSERVARKTAYCRRTPKGASRGWSFLSWKKKQCESARCAIRPRKLESDEIRYFHACSPSKFVALVVQDGWDDIGCQLHRYFCFSHKRLARWFHHCDLGITVFLAGWVGKDIFWGTFLKLCPRSEGLAHFARKQLVSWVLFLGSLRIHLSDVILSGSADGISSMEGYLSIHPLHLAKNWSCITFETAWAYFRSCVAFLGCWCCCGAKCQVGLRGSAGSAPAVRRWNAISFARRLSRPQEMQHTSISVWEWYRCWKQAGPFWVNLLEIVCHGRLEPGQRWQALWFLCSWPLFG